MQDDFPKSSLRRQFFGKADNLRSDAAALMVGMNGHLAKLDDAIRRVHGGQDDASDKFAVQICRDMNVRLFFHQFLRGEIQSQGRSQEAAAKFHQGAIAGGIAVYSGKLQHVDALFQIIGGTAGETGSFAPRAIGPQYDDSRRRRRRAAAAMVHGQTHYLAPAEVPGPDNQAI